MKAMVLAAGLGTRLKEFTKDRPKALVKVNGQTMLEITLEKLQKFGVREVILNTHHFPEMMREYVTTLHNKKLRIELSEEHSLLDTGGGLKKAAWFFLEDPDYLDEPFILHNVDILSTIDLERMMQFHRDNEALATLAVQKRDTSRYLIFDENLQLCGWKPGVNNQTKIARQASQRIELAFCGIHVISPRLLQMIKEQGVFPIIDAYLNLTSKGAKIVAFRADEYRWRDIGSPSELDEASRDFNS